MAAIHAGVLEDERGGEVTFLKAPGNDSSSQGSEFTTKKNVFFGLRTFIIFKDNR